MAKGVKRTKGSIIGALGAILIGAAILLFVAIQLMTEMKAIEPAQGIDNTTSGEARWADWNTSNATMDSLITFLTIVTILFGVLGITMVGSTIITYISAGFA